MLLALHPDPFGSLFTIPFYVFLYALPFFGFLTLGTCNSPSEDSPLPESTQSQTSSLPSGAILDK